MGMRPERMVRQILEANPLEGRQKGRPRARWLYQLLGIAARTEINQIRSVKLPVTVSSGED